MMRCAMIFAVVLAGCGGSEFTASSADGGGGAPVDGGGTSWCASRPTPPTFCADFDETTDLATVVSAWSAGKIGDGTVTVQADSTAPSPPNVLSATADGTVVLAKSGTLTLGETVSRGEAIRSVHAETAIRLDQGRLSEDLDSATFLGIFYGGNTLFLALVKAGLVFGIEGGADGGALAFTPVPGTLTQGQWGGSYAIDLDVETGKVKISHDSVDVADTTVPPSPEPSLSTTMAIGVATYGVTGTIGFSFDDVRMDVN